MFLSHWGAPGACPVVPLGPSEDNCSRGSPWHALRFSMSGQPTPPNNTQNCFCIILSSYKKMLPSHHGATLSISSQPYLKTGTGRESISCNTRTYMSRSGVSCADSPCKSPFGSNQTPTDLGNAQEVITPPGTSIFHKTKAKPAHILPQGWYSHTVRLRRRKSISAKVLYK